MVNYYGTFESKAVAIYHLDGDGTDSSANAQTMTTAAGSPTFAAGRIWGQRCTFDGNDALGCANNAVWGVPNFTIGFWAYPTDHPDAGCMFGTFGSTGGSTYGFTARYNDSSYFQLYISDGGYNEGVAGTSTNTYAINNWYHVIMDYTRSTTTGHIYVNGKLDMTKTNFPSMSYDTSNNYPRMGCRNIAGGNDRFFVGILDDVWMVNYAMTYRDVKMAYGTAIGKFE